MHIDWAALAIVAVVSIVSSVVFVALLAAGIRVLTPAQVGSGDRVNRPLGYGLLGLAGLLVLYGLYLIVPQFH
ncbi:hypothetical protein [uncultured Friedmanniella sp.]|uniref:hypothetical protein n=1 Tax=uncultured Friedmanniella sp. TaxID=335381 RepID=UPI0035CAE161